MKKIFIGLVMLVALVSCNAKISDKLKNQMNGKESVTEGNSIDKYNANVDFHSRLASNFSNQIDDYLLEFGQEKNLKVKDSDPSFISFDLTSEITRYKEAIGKGPSFGALDDNAKKMLPILEELNKVFTEADQYYKGGDYREDSYKKGQELHTKILSLIPQYDKAFAEYSKSLFTKAQEVRMAELKRAEKEGKLITANRIKTGIAIDEILDEMDNEKLTGANFTEKGDAVKLKAAYDKFVIAQEELRKVANDSKMIEKENFNESSVKSYVDSVVEFKKSISTLIDRIKSKTKTSDFNIERFEKDGQKLFLETEEGTPENVYKKADDVTDNYNRMNY